MSSYSCSSVQTTWLRKGESGSSELLGRGNGYQKTRGVHCNQFSPALPTVYVGLATVAAATWWFLYDAEGPQVTFYQLVSKGWPGSLLGASGR